MSYMSIGEVIIKHTTKKAVLVEVPHLSKDIWIPFSVIAEEDLCDLEPGVIKELNVAQWFADKEIDE